MAKWIPAPVWVGQDAYIIGGGPSLKEFDFDLLLGKLTIGCNDAYQLGADRCKVLHFSDVEWLEVHFKRLEEFKGTITTSYDLESTLPRFRLLKRYETGLHRDGLGYNGNTGMSALNLALLYGATTVYLLGFDMALASTGEANWHPNEVNEPSEEHYQRFLGNMGFVVADWKEKFPKTRIINLNINSKLESFPKQDWRTHKWAG
jgi:hypothetical protein